MIWNSEIADAVRQSQFVSLFMMLRAASTLSKTNDNREARLCSAVLGNQAASWSRPLSKSRNSWFVRVKMFFFGIRFTNRRYSSYREPFANGEGNITVQVQRKNKFPATDQNYKGRYLLVADSDIDCLFYTSILLQRFGYYPHIAKTAHEAFIAATTATPSLIITALDLTDLNGLDFIRLLRKNSGSSDIPCIALRKQNDSVDEHHCFSAGAAGCLTKPVSAEVLYHAVQTAIETTCRTTIRIQTVQVVKVQNSPSDKHSLVIHSANISENGVFLKTCEPEPLNTRLFLKLNLNGQIIAAEALVVYHTAVDMNHPEPGMGLKFIQITPRDREIVRRFIKAETSQDCIVRVQPW
jgi:two-component system chemotaxis response regulator CheY